MMAIRVGNVHVFAGLIQTDSDFRRTFARTVGALTPPFRFATVIYQSAPSDRFQRTCARAD